MTALHGATPALPVTAAALGSTAAVLLDSGAALLDPVFALHVPTSTLHDLTAVLHGTSSALLQFLLWRPIGRSFSVRGSRRARLILVSQGAGVMVCFSRGEYGDFKIQGCL